MTITQGIICEYIPPCDKGRGIVVVIQVKDKDGRAEVSRDIVYETNPFWVNQCDLYIEYTLYIKK